MKKILISFSLVVGITSLLFAPPPTQPGGWPPAAVVTITNTVIEQVIITTNAPETIENTIPEGMSIEDWQASKTDLLKTVENLYVSFLTNDWTMCLRTNNIITTNNVITVDNTTEVQNIGYLMYLRSIDKRSYYDMAGEFDRFKVTIIANGGIMSQVIVH